MYVCRQRHEGVASSSLTHIRRRPTDHLTSGQRTFLVLILLCVVPSSPRLPPSPSFDRLRSLPSLVRRPSPRSSRTRRLSPQQPPPPSSPGPPPVPRPTPVPSRFGPVSSHPRPTSVVAAAGCVAPGPTARSRSHQLAVVGQQLCVEGEPLPPSLAAAVSSV